jgi:hypothetical protein
MQRGGSKPFQLVYHPKSIVGDPFDGRATLGDRTAVEIVPGGKAGALSFRVVAQGKPLAGAEVNVVLPDGERTKITTDALGQTTPFTAPGRYAAWTRYFEPAAGEHAGKPYEEVRHYATLVIDVGNSGK